MKLSLEDVIAMVVKEVIAELSRRGIRIDSEIDNSSKGNKTRRKIKIDMKEYKTPLLTEARILELDSKIEEIEIPSKTIITPSAQDLIRKRKLIITKK